MEPTTGALLLVIGAVALLLLLRAARRRRDRARNDLARTENQLRFVGQSRLRAVRPVNGEAVRVLYALEDWIGDHRPDWRLSFEVAMGAFVKTASESDDRLGRAAFSSYNSKRVDFLLVDGQGYPRLVVEYHGTGHDLSGDAEDRMAVKRLALQRAGIPLAEIPATATRTEILAAVAQALGAAPAGRPKRG
ncbi:hypothetical protein GCM10011390_12000 [Aureimonas endophytica]|uniref:DUF2726 domain-containing protein n=1 Tax=Aureimonas endophytica TaxID=2027858 RepID=A0A917E1E0_9HYPH|nr:DUF2726 domain-containing protein [Aureimonas endophytica]GGD94849.1 hypothetical protein GCM10011390_12000 [Aureimonas endophytica]